MTVTLYLVRHGAADGATGRCVGWSDLPLSMQGHDDIVRLASHWPAPGPSRVIASDLARARDSALALASDWQVDAETDARLREMHFGEWDGCTWAELERDDPERMAAWMAAWQEARTPGGEGFGDVIARASDWLADAVRRANDDGVDALVVVAHAGSIRALLVHAIGLPRSLAFRLRIDHARVSALHISGDHAELLFLNADRVPDGS